MLRRTLVGFTATQLLVVWSVSSYFFPGYNSVSQSLSELAADDSPVRWIVRLSLITQAVAMMWVSNSSNHLALAGQRLHSLAANFLALTALVPSPSQSVYSPAHRILSFLAFAFGCLWPAFASSRRFAGLIPRQTGIWISVFFLLLTIASWLVWAFASNTYFGLMQRVNVFLQSFLLAWVLGKTLKTQR